MDLAGRFTPMRKEACTQSRSDFPNMSSELSTPNQDPVLTSSAAAPFIQPTSTHTSDDINAYIASLLQLDNQSPKDRPAAPDVLDCLADSSTADAAVISDSPKTDCAAEAAESPA